MKLLIIIQQSLYQATAPLEFVRDALKDHEIVMVFFQFDSVYIALPREKFIQPNLTEQWTQLSEQTQLMLCQGSCEKRGIAKQFIAKGFETGGFGILSNAMELADKIITFEHS